MDFSPDRPAFFVNPDFRPMAGAPRAIIDPATLATVGATSAATDAEIDAALTAATTRRRPRGSASTPRRRAKHLHAVASAIEAANLDWCAELMVARDGQALSRGDRRDRQLRRRLPLLRRDGARRGGQDRRHDPGRLVPVSPATSPTASASTSCPTISRSCSCAGRSPPRSPPATPRSSSRREATTLSTLEYMKVFRALPPGLVVLPARRRGRRRRR